MEEWLQTEWPHLQVRLTSVTEQWHTFPVVGPKSRDVIGAVFPDVDVSNDAFPFMAWRDTTLDGVHVRVGTGQLLRRTRLRGQRHGWYATAVWERLIAAGEPYGITPVRHRDDARAARREGLPDHRAGHRRHRHPAGPRHGLGGVEEEARLHRQAVVHPQREPQPAAQAVRRTAAARRARPCCRRARRSSRRSPTAYCRRRPCRCSGTSPPATAAPNWAARSRWPWSRAGDARIGDTLHVPVDGTLVPVEVTGTVLVDPEGARRDG